MDEKSDWRRVLGGVDDTKIGSEDEATGSGKYHQHLHHVCARCTEAPALSGHEVYQSPSILGVEGSAARLHAVRCIFLGTVRCPRQCDSSGTILQHGGYWIRKCGSAR